MDDTLEQFRETLSQLGAESETERTVKRVAPWALSLLIHGMLVMIGFIATWTVISTPDQREPALVVADFHAVEYEPLTTELQQDATERDAPTATDIASDMPTPTENRDAVDVRDLIADAARQRASASFDAPAGEQSARFLGLSATNARDIVYVIDASGSMIRSLQIVVEELARSLDRLSDEQRFSIIFFQRNEAIMVPPPNRLRPANEQAKIDALRWIRDSVIPAGRSNPLPALQSALDMQPDVIFLLSENITGSGQWEIDQSELLAELERLNPPDPETGRRRTQINCVQFLDPDPLDTLRKIAETHGGSNGYRFLDRRELGIALPE